MSHCQPSEQGACEDLHGAPFMLLVGRQDAAATVAYAPAGATSR